MCRGPRTPWPRLGPQSSSPTTSGPTRGPLSASARPPPRGPSGQLPSPPAAAAAAASCGLRVGLGRRGTAPARGERPGSGPGAPRFSPTPTWRRPPPPPATTTPPRATDGPGTAGRSAGKFRFSSPDPPGAGGQPTQPPPTRPGAGSGSSQGPTPPRPERRARTLPAPQPRPPGCAASGSAQPARSGRGGRAGNGRSRSQVTPPPPLVEPHYCRLGWSLFCARTGAPPPTRQARARGHEHTHTARSPPFPAGSLAPPVGPARHARGGGATSEATPISAVRPGIGSSAQCGPRAPEQCWCT